MVQLLDFAWWEITGKCQLTCGHCYASSGPDGKHSAFSHADWRRVISETRQAGAQMGQFIGGEPTLHPYLGDLVRHALSEGLEVEVYSNLVRVTPELWETFQLPGVRLATSYYSDDAVEHAVITGRPTHRMTTANIRRAVELGIPLRAGVVGVREGQRSFQATTLLQQAGVEEIGYDDLREVGRGVRENGPGLDQLCGRCGNRQVAISPTGEVWPCVFSRWLPVGNVLDASLVEILTGDRFAAVSTELAGAFGRSDRCSPDECNPKCGPKCGPACQPQYRTPCNPRKGCSPTYGSCNPDKRLCDPDRSCKPNQCRPTK